MSSSNTSQHTRLSLLKHLDIAYVIILLPLLLIIKVPMLIFMSIILGLLIIRKKPTNFTLLLLTLLGGVAIFISLYGAFNFAGLSRLKLFLELLVYLLIVAVSLQRITRTVNFYLLLSPLLLLALSLFFFHSIGMLIYVVFEVFVILWLILSYRMQGETRETLRMAGMMFLFSLPWVVVLFIFFPRISFDHASYGFKGEHEMRMGHDGTMFIDNNALLVPSSRVVMEVEFDGHTPLSSQLYFRGSLLYVDKKDHWEPMPHYKKRSNTQKYTDIIKSISYSITLYPTYKKWLYGIDMPIKAPLVDNNKINMDSDFILTSKKPITEPIHYQIDSALRYNIVGDIDVPTRRFSLAVDHNANPQSWKAINNIKKSTAKPQLRVDAIVKLFKDANLTYTLHPRELDINNSTDSFLFDTKLGYCVHFASSFVTMARMADVPARVVTGYKANSSNSIKNYLSVKEIDAHAWAELYLNSRWVRYDPTSFASRIDAESAYILSQSQRGVLAKVNLQLMYIKYQVETWILHYSHISQIELLEKAKNNPEFVSKFIAIILLITLVSLVIIAYLRKPICHDSTVCLMYPLVVKLQKIAHKREDKETMNQYLLRYVNLNPDRKDIANIAKLYESVRYSGDNSDDKLRELKSAIKSIRKLS